MPDSMDVFAGLRRPVADVLSTSDEPRQRLQRLCELLRAELAGYDWVGFYLVDPAAERTLFLGPFDGAPTDHVRIPFGKGICGQAADRGETFVIDDVSLESNYLACSTDVRSEIVVPIHYEGRLVGELDVDSNQQARFDPEHRSFLEAVAQSAAPLCAIVADAGAGE